MRPTPLSISIPTGFLQGQSSGSVTCISPYVARVEYNPPLVIADNSVIELNQCSFAYSQPNVGTTDQVPGISTNNNNFTIIWNAISTTYTIPTGLYEYLDIAYQMNYLVYTNPPPGLSFANSNIFTLQGISSTQKILLSINPSAFTGGSIPLTGFTLRMNTLGFGKLLGFTVPSLFPFEDITAPFGSTTPTSQLGDSSASFSDVSSYVLQISLVSKSYQNGLIGQILANLTLGSYAPNSIASYMPALRYPVPCFSGTINYIDVFMTDQSGNRLKWEFFQAPTQFSCLISKSKSDGSL